jgi:ABC-type multidrug transport system ATPase subunit
MSAVASCFFLHPREVAVGLAPPVCFALIAMIVLGGNAFFESSSTDIQIGAAFLVPVLFSKAIWDFSAGGVALSVAGGSSTSSWPLFQCILATTAHVALSLLVLWIADNVQETPLGVRRPWTFFLRRDYWTGENPEMSEKDPEDFFCGESLAVGEDEDVRLEREAICALFDNDEYEDENLNGIIFQNTTVQYRRTRKTEVVSRALLPELRYLYLRIQPGQTTCVLGPRGCGKSTLARLLAGVVSPVGGTVLVDGRDVFSDMGYVRSEVGVSLDFPTLWPNLSPSQHVSVISRVKSLAVREALEQLRSLLVEFQMERCENKPVYAFSLFERRKLSIILAMIGQPSCIVLDSPALGLLPHQADELWKAISKATLGKTVLIVSSNSEEALSLADRLALMVGGCLLSIGRVEHLQQKLDMGYILQFFTFPKHEQRAVQYVMSVLPEATLRVVTQGRVDFRVPRASSDRLTSLAVGLDANKSRLGISKVLFRRIQMDETLEDLAARVQPEFQKERRAHRRALMDLKRRKAQRKRRAEYYALY